MRFKMKLAPALLLLIAFWLATAGAAAAGPKAGGGGDTSEPSPSTVTVDPAVQALKVGAKIDVIVVTKNGVGRSETDCLKQHGGLLKKTFAPEKALLATINRTALDHLVGHSNVAAIITDQTVNAHGTLDVARATTGFGTSAERVDGTGIAVIDSGIAQTNKIDADIFFKDYVGTSLTPYDDNGHGTHIAGIIAADPGSDSQKGFVARPKLLAVKVLAADGSGKMSNVIDAINWVVSKKSTYNIKVISLSLGTPVVLPWYQDPLTQAAEWAWNNGIVVVVSAGNSGASGPGTITSPGNDPLVITVGATDDKGTTSTTDDTLAPFSSLGASTDPFRKPDLLAPGTGIISLLAQNSYLAVNYPQLKVGTDYIKLSGTSMAAPMVAGQAAVLAYKYSSLKPNQIKNVMLYTARNRSLDFYAQGYGYESYSASNGYLNGLGGNISTKISNVNPGLVGTTMATGDGLTGQLAYDWLMQDGVLVDDQLISWLRDTRGVDEFLVFWLRDHGLLNQTLIYYLADNPNLTPDNVEPQLVRWSFANNYLTTLNVDQLLIHWMNLNPAVQSELAYWLSNLNPIVNQQLIWYLQDRGVDPTLITWLTNGGLVDGTLIRWLADHYYLSGTDLNSNLVYWMTEVDGRMNNTTVTREVVYWLGTNPALYSPIETDYLVWKSMYP